MQIIAGPQEQLTMAEASIYLGIPLSSFREQFEGGIWDGCFTMQNSDARFIAGLLIKKQEANARRWTAEQLREAKSRAHKLSETHKLSAHKLTSGQRKKAA